MDYTTNNVGKNIVQWNIQGISNKKQELLDIISKIKPEILSIQETMLRKDTNFSLKHYNGIFKEGHTNRRAHGGVALFIHESIPYQDIKLNTPLQAVAVRANLGREITVVSVYNSRSHELSEELMTNLYRQLPKPIIITGDFNSYHEMWGNNSTDSRGHKVMDFAQKHQVNILNDGRHTRTDGFSRTAIDLTIVSPSIQHILTWNVTDSPLDSDHCLITINIQNENLNTPTKIKKYNIRKADWHNYKSNEIWTQTTISTENRSARQLKEELYGKIQHAAMAAIPVVEITKRFPKSWWSKELEELKNKRERFYKIKRKTSKVEHVILWKKTRAQFKRLAKKNKKEDWENFASSLNSDTPLNKVWNKMRHLKGKDPKRIIMLEANGTQYQDSKSIADLIGDTLAELSLPQTYSRDFLEIKAAEEAKTLQTQNGNRETYNKPFSKDELIRAISSSKNTAPGPDEIHSVMLKNLPESGLDTLHGLYNSIWNEGYFPEEWLNSTIIPIAKPGKDPSNPSNYRPIALTSIMCKLMERMVNLRLLDYFDQEGTLSVLQCGGRSKRSTIDHLISLEATIRKAQANNEHVASIFFDMEKAYDMTWRHGILKDLSEAGVRGKMFDFIKNFLKPRMFRVKVDEVLSDTKTQTEGIPQGSVLSPTLFILKINKIIANIANDNRYQVSLYMDDLQISYRHPDLKIVERKLQESINSVQNFAEKNGFKFSTNKTSMIYFTSSTCPPPIELRLGDTTIQKSESVRYLGLVFDSKLNWKPHIQQLKSKCNKALDLMKSVSSTEWGADQKTLMTIYRSLIRSKLDYGCIVYNSANNTDLTNLESISNEAMRIASGCFRSTPIHSLQVITSEPPLQIRRDKLSLRYFYKTRSLPQNPAFKYMTPEQETLYSNRRIQAPFAIRIARLHECLNLNSHRILPDFSYRLQRIKEPTWSLPRTKINLDLTDLPKESTPLRVYQQKFREIKELNYKGYKHIYTDGSKSEIGVGAAAITEGQAKSASLPKHASIFTAEAYAVHMTVDLIRTSKRKKFSVFTDSRSVLQALDSSIPTNPLIRKLKHKLADLQQDQKEVELCWVPGHAGIPGNETADRKAKEAARKRAELIICPYTDVIPLINKATAERWNRQWISQDSKLRNIKPNTLQWKEACRNRKDETVINRLRAGHTHLTHSYLMEGATPPPCELCQNHMMSVKHLLTECDNLNETRERIFRNAKPTTLKEYLGEGKIDTKVINFLKDCGIYHRV